MKRRIPFLALAILIAAAVAAMGAAEGKAYAVRSVKKKGAKPGRNPWAAAAVTERTRSF